MNQRPPIYLYTDGASSGNPGPGGYGVVLRCADKEKEMSEGFSLTTNNRMELLGVITGLEALTKPCRVEVITDSKYVSDAFNAHWIDSWVKKGWKRGKNEDVKNVDLWKRLLKAMEPHQVTFTWVKGHAGHPENERCDRLAVAAGAGAIAEGKVLPPDTGYVPEDKLPL